MLRRVVVGTLILLGASCINVAGDNLSFQNSSTEQAAYSTRQLLGASGKCDNEPGYFFKGNKKKGCDWVAKNAKKRCKKKDKKRNRKKVKVFCPSVCKNSCATKPLTKPPVQSPTDACACNDDGDGPINKVPASGTCGEFQAIVDNYFEGDTSADSSRKLYGDKIACWNVDSVTNMFEAFSGYYRFNEPIGCWNTESVTDMYGMFYGARAFNQDIGKWNVASVADMYEMFRNAHAFNQDISEWDVASVTDMNSMFAYTPKFNQNLCSWDIQADANTDRMFLYSGCANQDDPTASAVCQSCESRRRRLAATDGVGVPNSVGHS